MACDAADNAHLQDYWRAIVLSCNNVATYKIALAAYLIAFAEAGATQVAMMETSKFLG